MHGIARVRVSRNPCRMDPVMAALLSRSLSLASLLLTGAIAGFFYAYWCSVMMGLDAAGPEAATAAMQGINRTVRNPMFAPAFFGPLLVLPLAAVAAVLAGSRIAAVWLAAACVLYGAGAFLPTLTINVPMNNAFAAAPASAWATYADQWGYWNGVRTIMSFAALAAVGLALMASRPRTA